jgi:hypothetical protein
MKKKLYVFCFALLGALVGFFLHGIIENAYISLLLQDFGKYGLGLTWYDWETIHTWGVALLVSVFGIWGFYGGQRWWRILYVQKKYKRWGKPLKENF